MTDYFGHLLKYNPSADICVMALGAVFLILLNSTFTIKQKNLIVFSATDIFMFVAAASDVGYHYFLDHICSEYLVFIYILRNVFLISLAMTYYLFIAYALSIANFKKRTEKFFYYLCGVAFILFALFEIFGVNRGIGLRIDENLNVVSGYYLDPFGFLYTFYTFVLIFIFVKGRERLVTKMKDCLVTILSFSYTIMLAQIFFCQTSFICITYVFPTVSVLFLFHYNAYDMETGMLDAKSFVALMEERKGRRLGLVYLFLDVTDPYKIEGMRDHLYHFNEKYFDECVTFRLRDQRFCMVYDAAINEDYNERMTKLLKSFYELYDKYRIDYKVVVYEPRDEKITPDEHLGIYDYIDRHMRRNTVKFCDDEDIAAYRRESTILTELEDIKKKNNLNDSRVMVYAHPLLDVASNKFDRVEAVMRLNVPKLGMVYPSEFMNLLIDNGFMHLLTLIVLNKACRSAAEIIRSGYKLDMISINVTPREMLISSFAYDICNVIDKSGLDYDHIAFEVSGGDAYYDYQKMGHVIRDLKRKGISFYIDGFGYGLATLGNVFKAPFDIVKFDKCMTKLLAGSNETKSLVKNFAELFDKDIYTISYADVESDEDEERCIEAGAGYLQGSKFTEAIPIDQVTDFLEPGL